MKSVNLHALRSQYRGSRYADLVAHHLRRQSQEDRVAGAMGTRELLPAPLQPAVEEFVDRWNVRAYDRTFWDRDAAGVMDEILADSAMLAERHGVTPDDETLFNLFTIITMSFAYSAYDQPKMREFMGVEDTMRFPVWSTVALLYPLAALVFAIASDVPLVPAFGYGIAQLSYVLGVAGIFGRFGILGLTTRRSVWGWAVGLFLFGVITSNVGW